MHASKKSERGNVVTYSLSCISSIESKKRKISSADNLAAKPFFLGIISSSSLLSHPSRARNVAQPSSHFLQTIPTSWLLPGLRRSPPLLSVVSLSRSHPRAAPQLVVWHPRSLEWQTARSEGLTFAERMKRRNVYLFVRTLSWERSRYLRNVKYLAT